MFLGNAIRRARERLGWERRKLARLVRVSNTTMLDIERGTHTPRVPLLMRLAATLNVPEDELLHPRPEVERRREASRLAAREPASPRRSSRSPKQTRARLREVNERLALEHGLPRESSTVTDLFSRRQMSALIDSARTDKACWYACGTSEHRVLVERIKWAIDLGEKDLLRELAEALPYGVGGPPRRAAPRSTWQVWLNASESSREVSAPLIRKRQAKLLRTPPRSR
jgi:transcriptional regulator with XRE-family HTH domain